MTYDLIIGDRAYSSWSLRGWLVFEAFGLKARTTLVDFKAAKVADQLADYPPARTVPTLKTPEGAILGDSIAIAEEVASRHPEAGLWPEDPKARAIARSLTAEMHSGFAALREACPMNLRLAYTGFTPDDAVKADLARLEAIWAHARDATGSAGPWLCGAYSIADAFYAPVAARIAGYSLPVGPEAQAYTDAHLAHLPFRRWRAMGLAKGAVLNRYKRNYATRTWPGPKPVAAEAAADGPSENARCPYSGDPVTDFLKIGDRTFGFCNPFCRDKTLHDPEAWPDFMEIYQS